MASWFPANRISESFSPIPIRRYDFTHITNTIDFTVTWTDMQEPFTCIFTYKRSYDGSGVVIVFHQYFSNRKYQAEKRRTASSFQVTPVPMTSSMIAMPFSTRSGSVRIGFHQSAYSNQWAVGVQHSRRALISGQR